jgi:hypothetical protein
MISLTLFAIEQQLNLGRTICPSSYYKHQSVKEIDIMLPALNIFPYNIFRTRGVM